MTASLTEPITRTFRRVVGDPRGKLSDAMSQIQTLRAELAFIEKQILQRGANRFERAVQERKRAWEADSTNIQLEVDYCLAALISREEAQRLEPIRRSWIACPPQEQALEQLFKKRKDWRDVLRKACTARLQMAEAEYSQTEKSVRAELRGEGFDQDDIESHPKLKRARSQKGLWQACINSLTNSRDDSPVWRYTINNLFNEDS